MYHDLWIPNSCLGEHTSRHRVSGIFGRSHIGIGIGTSVCGASTRSPRAGVFAIHVYDQICDRTRVEYICGSHPLRRFGCRIQIQPRGVRACERMHVRRLGLVQLLIILVSIDAQREKQGGDNGFHPLASAPYRLSMSISVFVVVFVPSYKLCPPQFRELL